MSSVSLCFPEPTLCSVPGVLRGMGGAAAMAGGMPFAARGSPELGPVTPPAFALFAV